MGVRRVYKKICEQSVHIIAILFKDTLPQAVADTDGGERRTVEEAGEFVKRHTFVYQDDVISSAKVD
ncbi:hypothetical protein KIN20_037970 [Parelaphostrongylus tenuis]|uniref:Uncharacterized protein n=1 Tax=Parelaphostrongylus tenuis TaxID=148309 RepID=A0AAD5RF24_PARTN|nr:hypothetical protein KIN20_037970 [Parelaphostrongylus tenuis]